MSLGRLAGGALLVTSLAATMGVGTYWTASTLQSDLSRQAQSALSAKQVTATVVFSGRDAYVWAPTISDRADAIAAVRAIPGVRLVLIGEGAAPSQSATQAPPTVEPTANGGPDTLSPTRAGAGATAPGTSLRSWASTGTASASAAQHVQGAYTSAPADHALPGRMIVTMIQEG